jgi:PAS domain S-box-containing protein
MFWNRGAERIYGWPSSEVIGRRTTDFLFDEVPTAYAEARECLAQTGEWRGELRQITRDARTIFVQSRWTLVRDEKGEPKSVLVINTDVTEQRKLEGQFLRAQRMESIGTLAGGIAHDLNNVLSPILTAIQLLQAKTKDEDSLRYLALLKANAERGSEMVSRCCPSLAGWRAVT